MRMQKTIKETAPPKPAESSRKRGRTTGFEEWGGYMAAKKEKLSAQYEDQKSISIALENNKASEIFKGVAIFVNGYTRPPAEELKQLMLKHGGMYHYYYDPQRTTHIIATNLPDSKVKNLKDEKVVRPNWIVDSIEANKLLSYQDYLLYHPKYISGQATLNMKKICSSINKDKSVDGNNSLNMNTCSDDHNSETIMNSDQAPEDDIKDVPMFLSGIPVPSDDSISVPNAEAALLQSTSEVHKRSPENTQRNGFSVKAGDPHFLSEFYSHSRLHHIATSGQELKQYVQDIILARRAKGFLGREKLRHLKEASSFHDPEHCENAFCQSGNIIGRTDSLTSTGETLASCIPDCSTRSFSGKVVMHIDMDCFFVSVGLRKHPQLKGQPVAVTHSRGKRGAPQQGSDAEYEANYYRKLLQQRIVGKDSTTEDMKIEEDIFGTAKSLKDYGSLSEIASCSYEARAAGLHNGMFLGEALRLCPNLKTIPYDFEGYTEVSKQLYDTVADYSLDIEAVSCDELYVDCTELLEDTGVTPQEFASALRAEIFEKTGCTASAGMGSNMLISRLATKIAKPNGQYFLPESEVGAFMKKQKVEDLPGVGYIMASKLEHLGVITCGDLQMWSLEKLQKEFGPKNGQTLYDHCQGQDDRDVTTQKERKSVSAEINYGIRFETESDVHNFVNELAVEVHQRLKKIGKKGKALTLKLKMRKDDAPKQTAKFLGHGVCDSTSKSVLLKTATNDPNLIGNQCYQLIQGMKLNPEDYRGLGIQMGKLEPAADIEKSSKVMERFLSNATGSKYSPENSRTFRQPSTELENVEPAVSVKNSSKALDRFLSSTTNICPPASFRAQEKESLDESVLNALPEDIRNEVLLMYGKKTEPSPVKTKPLATAQKSPAKTKGTVRGGKKKAAITSPKKTLKDHFEGTGVSSVTFTNHSSNGKAQLNSEQSCKANLCGAVMINEVRDLLKEWFASMEVPLEDDIGHIKDYLLAVIEEKDLEKVDLVLKYFYRLASASHLLWREAYLSVLSYVQQKMLQDFGYMLKALSDF